MSPPRLAERVLEAFIGDEKVADDVLGDLAEEWSERVEREGAHRASWWYWKQVARSVAHLLRVPGRGSGSGRGDAVAVVVALVLVGVPVFLVTAWAGMMTSIGGLATAMFSAASSDGGETLPLTRTAPAIWAGRALLASGVCGLMGGWVTGRLARRAAMVRVSLLAGLCVPAGLTLQILAPSEWPAWYGLGLPAVLAVATLAGGLIAIAFREPGDHPPRPPGRPEKGFGGDLRYGVRRLARSPRFAMTAVAVLALGVGTSTAMFSIIDAVYLDDPPHIVDFGDLVRIHGVNDRSGASASLPYPDFAYYVEHQRSFDGLMGWGHSIALTIGRSGVKSPGTGTFVSYDYFDVLGTRPAAGRWFRPEEDSVAAPQLAAVISHGLWSGFFDSDPEIVGEVLTLNGTPFRVVGVAPRGFAGPSPLDAPPDVWVPFHAQPVLSPQDWAMLERPVNPGGWNWVQGIGRLREGVTLDAARADMTLLSDYLRENFAGWVNQGNGVHGDARFLPDRGRTLQKVLGLMAVAAVAVLLIAWANVSILLLVRGSDAVRDVAVRTALGASRWRVVRVVLVESLIVGGLGSASGAWLAYMTSGILAGTLPATFSVSFGLDVTVLAFACLLGLTVSVVSSLPSVLRTGRVDVIRTLKDGGRSGRGRFRMRNGLVVAQVALATGLALAAGLTARSVAAASSIPFGFDPEGRTLVTTTLSGQGYTDDQGRVFIGNALERIRSLPGVRSASTLSNVPFLSGFYSEGFRRPAADPSAPSGNMGINAVSPDFFDAMGIRMIAGRPIVAGDVSGAPPTLVVSASTARSLWPGQDPLGRRLYGRRGQLLWEVVGVAENTRVQDLDRSPELYGYTAVAQDYRATVTFVVRGEAPPAALREALYAENPALAISGLRSMGDLIDLVLSQYRTAAVLMNALAALSLLLAVTGLYGVLSFAVTQGRRDIGIRVALGASSGRVVWGVVRWALGLAIPGLIVGGTAAWIVAPALGSFLYGVDPRNAVVWTIALLALLVVTTASSLLPARRAARLDPVDVLSDG